MRVLRFIVKFLSLVANGGAALLLIASAYSDRVSPETSLLFSYLGLAFPLLCTVNLGFMCYWLFLGKWRYPLIGLCTFLVCWEPVKSYFPLHSRKEIPRGEVMKVLSYNVMGFGYKDHTRRSPNPILEYIAHSDADIVCLQEYTVMKLGRGLTDTKIRRALRMYPYRSVFYQRRSKYQDSGIAVYSKYPISRSRTIKYKTDFNGSSIHELTVKGKRFTLVNNHLESFKLTMEDRSRYSSMIKNLNPDGLDDLRGAFSQKLSTAFLIRAKQAERVTEEIRSAKGEYVLVCGDFNDTPISYAHRTVQGDLTDAFAASGRGAGITYNQNCFWFRIDHILHSSNITSMDCTVDKVPYSDHYPIWCYLRVDS